MVTGKYSIAFTDEKAPKINCKYSEVNREIIFTPDVDVSDSYSVELVIVKPDNTFTISTGVIADGDITVTIPSQATVVKGVGQYLIRIFDNTTNIYSAYGDIWVDDNLLTDDIIESVAEVNGYVFPDDFSKIDDSTTDSTTTWSSEKIANEIASATPDIIDDDNVLSDKTWSSDKISYELGNIQPYHVYTTTEQPVGRWIDGKTVYEKTFYITSVPTTTTANFDIGVPNLSRMILLEGFIMGPYNCFPINCWQNYTYNNTYAYFVNDLKKIVFYVGQVPGGTAHFIVRYTKSE